jgi:hypothetical protein
MVHTTRVLSKDLSSHYDPERHHLVEPVAATRGETGLAALRCRRPVSGPSFMRRPEAQLALGKDLDCPIPKVIFPERLAVARKFDPDLQPAAFLGDPLHLADQPARDVPPPVCRRDIELVEFAEALGHKADRGGADGLTPNAATWIDGPTHQRSTIPVQPRRVAISSESAAWRSANCALVAPTTSSIAPAPSISRAASAITASVARHLGGPRRL